jgi:hypothetical protein
LTAVTSPTPPGGDATTIEDLVFVFVLVVDAYKAELEPVARRVAGDESWLVLLVMLGCRKECIGHKHCHRKKEDAQVGGGHHDVVSEFNVCEPNM